MNECCYIDPATKAGCPSAAQYAIRDEAEQNPELAVTHSCEEHVGFLLGHVTGGVLGKEERWVVVPLPCDEPAEEVPLDG